MKRVLGPVAATSLALSAALASGPEPPDPWRPLYHFSPPRNFMNDPNGLVHLGGTYHLFYQHNPEGDEWGHMSWGHAVSPDMLRWEDRPVALREEDGVMVFSGSAVHDRADTSGLCAGRPEACLVAIYTGHTSDRQTQNLAVSTDGGRTWRKHAGNPVLDAGMKDFRDPKVLWHERTRRWVMAVALSTEKKIRFYASPDLRRWEGLSDFGPAGATEGLWECPDLFELPVDGRPAETRWVLDVDVGSGAPAGGSGGQYFVGDFDGTRFRADTAPGAPARWVDHGADFYASQSFSDMPDRDGRRIFMGWMSNWQYANREPTPPWRGMQSVPRELRLVADGDALVLAQRPARELDALRRTPVVVEPGRVEGRRALPVEGDALDIEAIFRTGSARRLGLAVRAGDGEETLVGRAAATGRLFADRTRPGRSDFHPAFAARHSGPLALEDGLLRLRVLVDRSSVEAFGGDGRTVISDRVFPRPTSRGTALFAEGGAAELVSLQAFTLAPALRRAFP
jgi:fructan beta-fructosidase